MRSYKKIMPVFLVLLLFASTAFFVSNKRDVQETYQAALTRARDLAEKKIYTDAIAQYKLAIKSMPSVELSYETGRVYLNALDFSGALRWYRDMVSVYPEEPLTYLYGIQANYLNARYTKAFEVYTAYRDRGLHSEDVEAYVDQFRYMYKLTGKFEDWKPFSNVTDMAAVKYHDKWGYVADSGEKVLGYLFEDAGLFSELAPVVGPDGQACYIDAKGNEKINGLFLEEGDPSFGNVLKFGLYQGGAFWAYNGKFWNAYRIDTYEKVAGGFKDVRPFSGNRMGAVFDGRKWPLFPTTARW